MNKAQRYRDAGHWPDQTLHFWLDENASRCPDRVAVKDAPNREAITGEAPIALTWSQLKKASRAFAAYMKSRGVQAGDRVLIQMPNVVDLVVVYYALSRLGAIISPIPVQYGHHEVDWVHSELKNGHVIVAGSMAGKPLAATSLSDRCAVTVMGKDWVIDPSAETDVTVDDSSVTASNILTICWTSGTTGTPKGVPRDHNMWMAIGVSNVKVCDYRDGDILLNPFPLVNMAAVGGFLFPAVVCGATLVLHHPIDVPVYLQQLQQERCTFTIAPPALLNQLAAKPDMWNAFDFSALRNIGSGAAPLSPWMIDVFENQFGKPILNFYGSNEGISLYSIPSTTPDTEMRASCFYRPAADSCIVAEVADPDSGELLTEVGAVGELLMGGPTVFNGYYNHDNQGVFSKEGMFRTGDLVEITGDDGRYLKIVGRCKEMINRGGFKLSPVELDLLLEKIDGVKEAAAFSIPDDTLGERVGAAIVLEDPAKPIDLETISAYFESQGVAKFKTPEGVMIIEALPRNPVGKVQRFMLNEIYQAQNA